MIDVIGASVAVVGSAFVLLAGIGVVRFPDLYSRMHAATKAPSLGFLLIALGAVLVVAEGRAKLLLAVAVVLVTAPIGAHLVGRSAYRAPGIEARLDAADDLAAVIEREARGE